ncbi:tetratricopeptide repeat protein [Fodinibius halophilus]|uniref:Tetratricopeptide repeat protein n=1 Tax=Fodinibius halophilus TaxID=1736908 RepID=A0A6M1T361_9BACT|nr:tetratricopeptide repeat protein [Fodinibius halophilus]NGP88507.1 tetratricopeptide repeat protein [Fodinibius halophilus]
MILVPIQELRAQSQQYGKVDFNVSCTDEVQADFDHALALMHHMMYEQARDKFKKVAESDSECAIAQWGIAMSYVHPLWGQRPADTEFKAGSKAIAKAKGMDGVPHREMAYINALEPFFKNWEATSYRDQLSVFEEGYRELHEQYPNDEDGAAFYALGHLATAPPEDGTLSHQQKAGAMLEELHEKYPQHPGLFHYIIHAYDNPKLAKRAVDVARAYDKVAPDVPHALHMPSHIFVRQGIWSDVIDWNKRSAEAALRQSSEDEVSMHYVHALDYLNYAYLQRGEDRKAKKVAQKTIKVENVQDHLGSAYSVVAALTRYNLEREEWDKSAQISLESPNNFLVDKYPAAQSMIYFARGIGSARSGNLNGARQAIEALNNIYQTLNEKGEEYWAVLTDAQRMAIESWMTFEEGSQEKALTLMKKAADTEDRVGKHPITPGHILPARELLGDILLKMDRPEEALKAYEESLAISANRLRSLYGAGRAAELAGDIVKAKAHYKMLITMTTSDEVDRPIFKEVRDFLATN